MLETRGLTKRYFGVTADSDVSFSVRPGETLAGQLHSKTARRLIRDWAALHQAELESNWQSARLGKPLERIAPLE